MSALPATWITYAKLALTALFWGGTFIAGRVVARDLRPFSAAFLRFLIAGALLLVIAHRKEGGLPRLAPRQWPFVIVLGMTGIFTYNAFFFAGLKIIEASRASLIVATCPVFLALWSAVFLREHLSLRRSFGIALSVTGAAVVISHGDLAALLRGSIGRGELFIAGAVASWVVYSMVGRAVMAHLSPLASVTYSVLVGAAALLPAALVDGLAGVIASTGGPVWASLFYLGAFGTVVGFVWYYEGIRHVGAVRAGLFINFVPVGAVVLSWLILGERPSASLLAGGALVVIGVTLTNRAR